ncbi:hypothetical protein Tco_1158256 [Tanacetum coccineum]
MVGLRSSFMHCIRPWHPTMPFERKREVKRDKAYADLENKCNEALQDLDKNPLVSDMRSKIKTLQGQVNGLHNEYGRLLLEERKWAIYQQTLSLLRGKDIDSLRQDKDAVVSKVVPDASINLFIVMRWASLLLSLLDEYDQAREDMANASYPFLSEFTSNPYAFVEQLLSMKPRSL